MARSSRQSSSRLAGGFLGDLLREQPVRGFFMNFFIALGLFHATDDIFRHLLGWNLSAGREYLMALGLAISFSLVLPRLPEISEEQRDKEKQILDQASAIDQAARSEPSR